MGGYIFTYDAHLRTCPSYFSPKSFVKIWFGLVEPFKSYRGNRQKKKNNNNNKTNSQTRLVNSGKSREKVRTSFEKNRNLRRS